MYVRTRTRPHGYGHDVVEPWCVVRFENPEGGDRGVFITWCRRRIEAGDGVQTSELPHALAAMCGACVTASSRGEVSA